MQMTLLMIRRLFFAIKLPDKIKEEIFLKQQEVRSYFTSEIKWVEKENLHITLIFLGMMKEEKIEKIISKTKEVEKSPFKLTFQKLNYFPPNKKKAKLIWASGHSRGLSDLEGEIKRKIFPHFKDNNKKEVIPHITLGRIRLWDFRRIPFEEIPEIEQELNLSFEIDSFDLIESKLNKKGPSYNTLERFNLKK